MIVTRRSVRISREELGELQDHNRRLIESNEVLSDDVRELQADLSVMAERVRSLTAQLVAERERLSYPWERPPKPVPPAPPRLIFHHGAECLGHQPENYTDGENCSYVPGWLRGVDRAEPPAFCPCPNLAGDCDGLHPGADLARRSVTDSGRILDGAGWLRGVQSAMGPTPATGHGPEDYDPADIETVRDSREDPSATFAWGPFNAGTADAIEDVIDRNRRLSE